MRLPNACKQCTSQLHAVASMKPNVQQGAALLRITACIGKQCFEIFVVCR